MDSTSLSRMLGLIAMVTLSFVDAKDDAVLVRFRNIANYDVMIWWIHGRTIQSFGHLPANGGMTSFTSYIGHNFFWAPPGEEHDQSKRRGHFKVREDKSLYLHEDTKSPGDSELVRSSLEEVAFLEDYYKTYGRHWLSSYQRPSPVLPFVEMDASGSTTKWVESESLFWICDDDEYAQKLTAPAPRALANTKHVRECTDSSVNPLRFMIEMVYPRSPRVYKIANFINEMEAEHIIKQSEPRLRRSVIQTGDDEHDREIRPDPTRTYSSVWLSMNHSVVIENIYRRIGDVLGVPNWRMEVGYTLPNKRGEVEGVPSHMEVMHYGTGEYYNRHYHNAVNAKINLYFVTFQVILRTSGPLKGGHTSFPHADLKGRAGLNVDSVQYDAVFWYNLLPDGNLDETSMYGHLAVDQGEQWMFTVSIWDPALPAEGDPKMPHERMFRIHDEL